LTLRFGFSKLSW